MYPDVVGEMVRVTVAFLYPQGVTGQQVEEVNTTWRCVVAAGGDSRQQLAQQVYLTFKVPLRPLMSTQTRLYGAKASVLGIYPPPLAQTFIDNVVGTGATSQTPTQARGLLAVQTDFGGRSARGRLYMFSPDGTNITTAGDPSAAYQAAITAIANVLLPGITIGGTAWRWDLQHRGAGHKPPYTTTPITAFKTRPNWATQRRSGESGRINVVPF